MWWWLWAGKFVLLSATTDHIVFSKAVAILSDCNLADGLRFSRRGDVCVCLGLHWSIDQPSFLRNSTPKQQADSIEQGHVNCTSASDMSEFICQLVLSPSKTATALSGYYVSIHIQMSVCITLCLVR